MSAKIGISTKGFQEWDYVTSQAGIDVGVLQGGFKKFAGTIDDATAGGEKQNKMFKELGVSLTDTNGKVKSTEQLFNESITAFTGMETGAHKSALASDLFGKSSTEMGSILNGTAKDLEDAKNRANELGLVLSTDAINAGDNFGDTMDNVKKSMGALVTGIGVEVMPVIQGLMDWIMANMPTIKENVRIAFETIKNIIIGTVDTIKDLTKFFQDHWNIIQPILVGIGAGALTFGLYTLAINAAAIATGIWTTVTGIATAVGSAFAAVIAFICSPIFLVVAAIVLLVAAGVLIYQNWDLIKTKAIEIWGYIKDTILMPVYNWLNDTFSPIFDLIKNIWSTALALIWLTIETTWNFLLENILKPVYNWLNDTFSPIFGFIKEAIRTAWDGLIEIISNIWNGIKNNVILPVYNWFKDTLAPIFLTVKKALTDAWDGLSTLVAKIWDGIKENFKAGINTVIGFVNGFITKINSIKITIPKVNVPGFGEQGGQVYGFNLPNIPGLDEGGTISRSGSVLVGESAPEILNLPRGASVTPLNKTGNIIINISGNAIMNDDDADRFGDLIVRRLKSLGVT